jgi:2-polyprenyl-3-methyl-5-hydroxy-6-metoxy-1,4-benzoquinol methylase
MQPRETAGEGAPDLSASWDLEWVRTFLLCPACGHDSLDREPGAVSCTACGRRMLLEEPGILVDLVEELSDDRSLTHAESVRRKVRRFYEANPFPNYDGFEGVGDLIARGSRGVYASMLDRQIPPGARILEVGCGTGQLGAYLSLGGRAVVGVDMTRRSLELAAGFKARHRLVHCNFLQANLFELPLKPRSFDLVICKGVLMATPDARKGFEAVCRMIRPGGYVILGLYNRFGRLPTSLRGIGFKLLPGRARLADHVLRRVARSEQKARSWYLDQYAHPQETRHSIDQLLRWFDEEGIEFVNAAPPIRFGQRLDPERSIFERVEPQGRLEHWLVQLSWIFTISREGALFDLVGQKPEGGAG